MRFHHMCLVVSDLDQAIKLWRDVLGFELQVQRTIPDGPLPAKDVLCAASVLDDLWKVRGASSSMAWLQSDGGAMIELQQTQNPQSHSTPPEKLRYADTGIHELGLEVDDIEHWFRRIRDAGYEMLTDYVWPSGNSAWSFLFYDHDGNIIQFWQQIPRDKRGIAAPYTP